MTASSPSELRLIGRAEKVTFPEFSANKVVARIDTGARTNSVWVSDVKEADGKLSFVLFGPSEPAYTGERVEISDYDKRMVKSSNGHSQERYLVRLLVKIKGKKIRARFTLADRSTQVYPVLIGRNALFGKFVVDVSVGRPLRKKERMHSQALQSLLNKATVKE